MARPVTVAYEYVRQRYRYTFELPDDPPPVEAHYCVHVGGRLECREVVALEGEHDDMQPATEVVFARRTDSVPGFTARQVGDDVWDVEIERRPGLLDELLPGRWPPDPEPRLFDEPVAERSLVHPDADTLATWTHELRVY